MTVAPEADVMQWTHPWRKIVASSAATLPSSNIPYHRHQALDLDICILFSSRRSNRSQSSYVVLLICCGLFPPDESNSCRGPSHIEKANFRWPTKIFCFVSVSLSALDVCRVFECLSMSMCVCALSISSTAKQMCHWFCFGHRQTIQLSLCSIEINSLCVVVCELVSLRAY